jgi:integrase
VTGLWRWCLGLSSPPRNRKPGQSAPWFLPIASNTATNPPERVLVLISTKGSTYNPEPLTSAEVDRLLAGCSLRAPTGIRNRALFMLLYRSGLRISEALALKPSNIDLERHSARVLHGKGDKATVRPLRPSATVSLARWLDRRAQLGLKNGPLFGPSSVCAPTAVAGIQVMICAETGQNARRRVAAGYPQERAQPQLRGCFRRSRTKGGYPGARNGSHRASRTR